MLSMKLPFKVSARTARLIGRENVATSKGAIIELVKNGYDADSKAVVVFIDNFYSSFHDEITPATYRTLSVKGIDENLLEAVYALADDSLYKIKDNVRIEDLEIFKLSLRSLSVIYIIDSGDGMTQNIIQNYWMTIGTDNKASDSITPNGRIKVGAKGIGRFALDKLGDECEMVTFYNPEKHNNLINEVYKGYHWNVNWSDFEGTSKKIDDVNASLNGIDNSSYSDIIHSLGLPDEILNIFDESGIEHGTILKITSPRDNWDDNAISQLYEDLGVLLPPSESNEFSIYLYASNSIQQYGKVDASICDDYDYKIVARADENQRIAICVYRNENDVDAIPPSFFRRENQQKYPFRLEDFRKGYWNTIRTFKQLCPGYNDVDIDHVFNDVGKFDFTFYYLKRGADSNAERRFFYRPCSYNLRKIWLDKYGGIKLFRDDFRVRPYGERRDSAFDWLGLGARKAQNPAGIARKGGGYRVEPENVAGLIKISRLTNAVFEDKSSREGLQENKTFKVLQELIKGIISIFEEDRSLIAQELDADDRERNEEGRKREEAENIVADVLKRSNGNVDTSSYNEEQKQVILLADLNRQKEEELEQMREEQKMLRALASSGLMLASFSHDLSKLKNTLKNRYDKIEKLFEEKVSKSEFYSVEERNNPFALIERAKDADLKIQDWFNFAIGVIRKDKRKRKNIYFASYMYELKVAWATIFSERDIDLNINDIPNDIVMRMFEIDLDSIFYNLFSNSVEAFVLMKEQRSRKIDVKAYSTDRYNIIEYYDSGVGLSPDIYNPDDIFKPFFTTHRNPSTGEEIGTGLGMWIVKSVIDDNDAKVNLLKPTYGFGLRFSFPIKYLR